MTVFDSTALSLAWDVPDPLNGQLAAYQLHYTNEASSAITTRLLFAVTQFRIPGLQAGVVYRIEIRASTVSLFGDTLWGLYAVLRVRDGVELEVPTTPMPTELPTTPPVPTTEEQETTQASVTTLEPTSQASLTTTAEPVVERTTEPSLPVTTAEEPTSQPAITTPAIVLNPPTVAPSQVLVHIPQGTVGQLVVIWRVSSLV